MLCNAVTSSSKRPEANLCKNLTSDEYDNFRKVVLEAVLSTDMAGHFAQITELSSRLMVAIHPGEDVEAAVAEGLSGGRESPLPPVAGSGVVGGAGVGVRVVEDGAEEGAGLVATITIDEVTNDDKERDSMAEPSAATTAAEEDIPSPPVEFPAHFGDAGDESDADDSASQAQAPVSDEEMQLLLARLLIKSADLSHVQQPYAEAAIWDEHIHKEFYEQGDLEVKLGFSPAPLFLRDENDPYKSDHWFYENMALPVMQALGNVVPNPGAAVVERVSANIQILAKEMNKDEEAESETFHNPEDHRKMRLTWVGPETGPNKRKVTGVSSGEGLSADHTERFSNMSGGLSVSRNGSAAGGGSFNTSGSFNSGRAARSSHGSFKAAAPSKSGSQHSLQPIIQGI